MISCILGEEREATIVGTYQSSIHRNVAGTYPAAKLIDGISLNGNWKDNGKYGCAHTEGGSMPEWYSLELASTQQVTKVRLVGRQGYTSTQEWHLHPMVLDRLRYLSQF